MAKTPVVDADGHVLEPRDMWKTYMDRPFRDRIEFTQDARGRTYMTIDGVIFRDHLRQHPLVEDVTGLMGLAGAVGRSTDEVFSGKFRFEDGPPGAFDGRERLKVLNEEGIDIAVLYPTVALAMGNFPDPAFAAAFCRAYNNWLYEYCSADRKRLIGVAAVPMIDVGESVKELRRAVTELGFKAAFVRPNCYGGRKYDDRQYDPFWAAAQELGVPIGFHPLPMWDMPGASFFFDFPDIMYVACVGFPLDSMVTFSYLVNGGVLERFPRLNIIILESGGGWIVHWLHRLDHYLRLFPALRPEVRHQASDYFQRQCWISFDPDEKILPAVVQHLGDDRIVWASDFPHFDATYPGVLQELREVIDPLPEGSRRKIVGENALRLYHIE